GRWATGSSRASPAWPARRVRPAGLDVSRAVAGRILLLARRRRGGEAVAEPPVTFACLLRQLRTGGGWAQEGLAGAASVGVRSVRDLERGKVATPQKETVRLLADALALAGPARAEFEAAVRGHRVPGGVAAATRALPRDIASFTGRQQELAELMAAVAGVADAGGVVGIHAIGGGARGGENAVAGAAARRRGGGCPAGASLPPLFPRTPR